MEINLLQSWFQSLPKGKKKKRNNFSECSGLSDNKYSDFFFFFNFFDLHGIAGLLEIIKSIQIFHTNYFLISCLNLIWVKSLTTLTCAIMVLRDSKWVAAILEILLHHYNANFYAIKQKFIKCFIIIKQHKKLQDSLQESIVQSRNLLETWQHTVHNLTKRKIQKSLIFS